MGNTGYIIMVGILVIFLSIFYFYIYGLILKICARKIAKIETATVGNCILVNVLATVLFFLIVLFVVIIFMIFNIPFSQIKQIVVGIINGSTGPTILFYIVGLVGFLLFYGSSIFFGKKIWDSTWYQSFMAFIVFIALSIVFGLSKFLF